MPSLLMPSSVKVSTIQGAGLSFPVASLLFVWFGTPYVFALLLAGALLGFGFGVIKARNPGLVRNAQTAEPPAQPDTGKPGWLAKKLYHPNLLIRLVSLVLFGAVLLLTTWCIGYYLLPDGFFRGGSDAHMSRAVLDTISANVVEEWGKVFLANLLPAVLILFGSLLVRVNGFSFGYLVALFNLAGYGLFLGTNSFAVAMPARMAPSLDIFGRSGPLEMLSLILLAAATYSWSFFEVKQLFRSSPQSVRPRPRFAWVEISLFVAGLGVLAAANWIEASMVVAALAAK